jgi:WD40 repeat protein
MQNHVLFAATNTTNANITKWNLVSKEYVNYVSHTSTVTAMDIAQDGKTMISASRDTTCNIWDLEKDKLKYTFIGKGEPVEAAAFISSKDSCTILGEELGKKSIMYWTVEKETIRIWNGGDGEFIWEMPNSKFLKAISAS